MECPHYERLFLKKTIKWRTRLPLQKSTKIERFTSLFLVGIPTPTLKEAVKQNVVLEKKIKKRELFKYLCHSQFREHIARVICFKNGWKWIKCFTIEQYCSLPVIVVWKSVFVFNVFVSLWTNWRTIYRQILLSTVIRIYNKSNV